MIDFLSTGETLQLLGTVIASTIGAVALIRANRSNISDKISRTQWAFEMYISFTGVCLSSDLEDDYKKYKAFYFTFYAYADTEIKKEIIALDDLIISVKKHLPKKPDFAN